MDTLFKNTLSGSFIFLMAISLLFGLSSCRKEDDDHLEKFKPSDFQVTIISALQEPTSSTVDIVYTVKNVSGRNYVGGDQYFYVKFTIRSTSNNLYNTTNGISDLDANAVTQDNQGIHLIDGETANLSTLTHEVIEQ